MSRKRWNIFNCQVTSGDYCDTGNHSPKKSLKPSEATKDGLTFSDFSKVTTWPLWNAPVATWTPSVRQLGFWISWAFGGWHKDSLCFPSFGSWGPLIFLNIFNLNGLSCAMSWGRSRTTKEDPCKTQTSTRYIYQTKRPLHGGPILRALSRPFVAMCLSWLPKSQSCPTAERSQRPTGGAWLVFCLLVVYWKVFVCSKPLLFMVYGLSFFGCSRVATEIVRWSWICLCATHL